MVVLCAVLTSLSLVTVLVYGAVFTVAAVATVGGRTRPDPLDQELDRFLEGVLGAAPAGTPRSGRSECSGCPEGRPGTGGA